MLTHFSLVQLFVTLWTIAFQASLSKGFSRQESWSGLPCPPPGDLLNPGIEPMSLMSPALAGGFFTTPANLEAHGLCSSLNKFAFIFLWFALESFLCKGEDPQLVASPRDPLETWDMTILSCHMLLQPDSRSRALRILHPGSYTLTRWFVERSS